jgi:peptidoglycan hydrolase-like protein with peptidoglycan-binding domain
MFRTLALVSALAAASLSANSLSAQSTATPTSKPTAAPAMKHASGSQAQDTTAKTTASTTHHAAWTKDQIKEAQEGLTKAGLYKGKATGVLNQDTKKALRAYQKQNNMPVTGRLNDDVLAKLKSA